MKNLILLPLILLLWSCVSAGGFRGPAEERQLVVASVKYVGTGNTGSRVNFNGTRKAGIEIAIEQGRDVYYATSGADGVLLFYIRRNQPAVIRALAFESESGRLRLSNRLETEVPVPASDAPEVQLGSLIWTATANRTAFQHLKPALPEQ